MPTDQDLMAAIESMQLAGERVTQRSLRDRGFKLDNRKLARVRHQMRLARNSEAPTLSFESHGFLIREADRCRRVAARLQLFLEKLAASQEWDRRQADLDRHQMRLFA